VKSILVIGRGGPYGCVASKLPHFVNNRLTDGDEVVSHMHRQPFTPWRYPVLIYIRGWVDPMAIVRPEVCQLRTSNGLIKNRIPSLPRPHNGPASNRNEYQEYLSGGKGWQPHRHLWVDNLENVEASTSDNPIGSTDGYKDNFTLPLPRLLARKAWQPFWSTRP
jgi:hypothetical protein